MGTCRCPGCVAVACSLLGWGCCQAWPIPFSQPWELLRLHRGEAVAFGARMRAEAGQSYKGEAMSKGGWHRDIRGVTFSSLVVTLQVCLSGR